MTSGNPTSSPLPPNVHISTHPCLRSKLSLLRSRTANARETKDLVHEIALIIGCEALGTVLRTEASGTVSPISTKHNQEGRADIFGLRLKRRSAMNIQQKRQRQV